MTTVGYARVSTTDQDLDIQIAALKREGCTTIRSEKRSGTSTSTPSAALAEAGQELARAWDHAQRTGAALTANWIVCWTLSPPMSRAATCVPPSR
jgi:hypothetical protein